MSKLPKGWWWRYVSGQENILIQFPTSGSGSPVRVVFDDPPEVRRRTMLHYVNYLNRFAIAVGFPLMVRVLRMQVDDVEIISKSDRFFKNESKDGSN